MWHKSIRYEIQRRLEDVHSQFLESTQSAKWFYQSADFRECNYYFAMCVIQGIQRAIRHLESNSIKLQFVSNLCVDIQTRNESGLAFTIV